MCASRPTAFHDPRDLISWLDGLDLVEFSTVGDDGRLGIGASLEAAGMIYGCGLFWFLRGPV